MRFELLDARSDGSEVRSMVLRMPLHSTTVRCIAPCCASLSHRIVHSMARISSRQPMIKSRSLQR
ncbi:hypothetical protein RHMOL_Rhmol10G0221800 [Rhododendron molle]|uniref:Uncharacterized protein n=1 Tax=Rhododendron molle TaxID=49168 RepID=A0ACC0M5H2_RHOML|nr:hypothetical protein RHMOL_Rhmol10G0221800 [Rhododendron molle]